MAERQSAMPSARRPLAERIAWQMLPGASAVAQEKETTDRSKGGPFGDILSRRPMPGPSCLIRAPPTR